MVLTTNIRNWLLNVATGCPAHVRSLCTVQYPDRKGKAAIFKYDSPDFKNNIYRGIRYLPAAPAGPLRFVVTDAPGRVVLHGPVSGQWTEIETAAWPSGVYFVRLEQGGRQVWAGKLMVR